MAEVRVRVACGSDIEAMHRIRLLVVENRLTDPARVQPRDYRAMLVEHGRGWVAESECRIVGFAVADRVRCNIWALFVDPAYEGRGIGRQLHDTMLGWLFATGVERAWLTTDPGTRAARFYETTRWLRAGREPNGETRYEMSREQWLSGPGAAPAR